MTYPWQHILLIVQWAKGMFELLYAQHYTVQFSEHFTFHEINISVSFRLYVSGYIMRKHWKKA